MNPGMWPLSLKIEYYAFTEFTMAHARAQTHTAWCDFNRIVEHAAISPARHVVCAAVRSAAVRTAAVRTATVPRQLNARPHFFKQGRGQFLDKA